MILRIKSSVLVTAALLALLSSCKVAHNYSRPEMETAGLYRDTTTTDTTTLADVPWREMFRDPQLQKLIEEGLSNNLDLKTAYSRVVQAEANFRQSRAAFFPSLNTGITATYNRLSEVQGRAFINNTHSYQLSFNTSWEADIWGRLSSSKRASFASLLQSRASTRALQTGLVANIASHYYLLLALDQQLAITRQSVKNWISTVETMQTLKEAAVVTGAAVVQSEANRYAAEVTIPDILQNIRETENNLSFLLGRSPGPIPRASFEEQLHPSEIHTGIPAQLLSNRPDVQEAEFNYRFYFENTNVARSYFYPAVTLSAAGGFSNNTLTDYFSPGSLFANVVGGLVQPIFNRRANRTRLEVARADQQQALFNFQNTLLAAGQEVSNALSLFQTASQKISSRNNQLNALRKSVEFSRELLTYGSANYTEVLNAQQSLLSAELGSVNDRLQQLQATVEIYRSLGGGWK